MSAMSLGMCFLRRRPNRPRRRLFWYASYISRTSFRTSSTTASTISLWSEAGRFRIRSRRSASNSASACFSSSVFSRPNRKEFTGRNTASETPERVDADDDDDDEEEEEEKEEEEGIIGPTSVLCQPVGETSTEDDDEDGDARVRALFALPASIWEKLFSFLEVDSYQMVISTCKILKKRLTHEVSITLDLTVFRGNKFTRDRVRRTAAALVRLWKRIRVLKIEDEIYDDQFIQLLRSCDVRETLERLVAYDTLVGVAPQVRKGEGERDPDERKLPLQLRDFTNLSSVLMTGSLSERLLHELSSVPKLRSLGLFSGRGETNLQVLKRFGELKRLKKLTLGIPLLDQVEPLLYLVRRCPLEELYFEESGTVTEEVVVEIMEAVRLSIFGIESMPGVSLKGWMELACPRHFQSLRILTLTRIAFGSGESVSKMVSFAPALETLDIAPLHFKHLYISHERLKYLDTTNQDQENTSKIQTATIVCPSLIVLNLGASLALSEVDITAPKLDKCKVWSSKLTGRQIVEEIVLKCPLLRNLKIGYIDMDEPLVRCLWGTGGCPPPQHLRKLRVDWSQVSLDVTEWLRNDLRSASDTKAGLFGDEKKGSKVPFHPNFVQLSLNGLRVSNTAFAALLSPLIHLKVLEVNGCPITYDSPDAILRHLISLQSRWRGKQALEMKDKDLHIDTQEEYVAKAPQCDLEVRYQRSTYRWTVLDWQGTKGNLEDLGEA